MQIASGYYVVVASYAHAVVGADVAIAVAVAEGCQKPFVGRSGQSLGAPALSTSVAHESTLNTVVPILLKQQ